jgi:hypothetical protein
MPAPAALVNSQLTAWNVWLSGTSGLFRGVVRDLNFQADLSRARVSRVAAMDAP